jgi:hypothetical protein
MLPERQEHHSGNIERTLMSVSELGDRNNARGETANRQANNVETKIDPPMTCLSLLACCRVMSSGQRAA